MPIYRITAPEGGVHVTDAPNFEAAKAAWVTAFRDSGASVRRYQAGEADSFAPHPGCDSRFEVDMRGTEQAMARQYVRSLGGLAIISPTRVLPFYVDRLILQMEIGARLPGLAVMDAVHNPPINNMYSLSDLVLYSPLHPYDAIA